MLAISIAKHGQYVNKKKNCGRKVNFIDDSKRSIKKLFALKTEMDSSCINEC